MNIDVNEVFERVRMMLIRTNMCPTDGKRYDFVSAKKDFMNVVDLSLNDEHILLQFNEWFKRHKRKYLCVY